MGRGQVQIIGVVALLAAAGAIAAPSKPVPAPTTPAKPLMQNCDAHRFETVIQLTGPDGKPKASTVKMCGMEGQTNAEWIHTLEDAVKKTSENPQIPRAAKEQIIAAVNAEITRLKMPALALPGGADISKLPKASATKPQVPLTRDYGSLGALPTADNVEPPHILGPGGMLGDAPKVTLRCALAGDEDRPMACDSIDRDTVLVVRADDVFPRGLQVRFLRHGEDRADLDLPALKPGQTANLRLPVAVCAGVVRSKVEIQAIGGNAPSGTPAGSIGEYDLRC